MEIDKLLGKRYDVVSGGSVVSIRVSAVDQERDVATCHVLREGHRREVRKVALSVLLRSVADGNTVESACA